MAGWARGFQSSQRNVAHQEDMLLCAPPLTSDHASTFTSGTVGDLLGSGGGFILDPLLEFGCIPQEIQE